MAKYVAQRARLDSDIVARITCLQYTLTVFFLSEFRTLGFTAVCVDILL